MFHESTGTQIQTRMHSEKHYSEQLKEGRLTGDHQDGNQEQKMTASHQQSFYSMQIQQISMKNYQHKASIAKVWCRRGTATCCMCMGFSKTSNKE